jgi:hypothetical protein
LEGISFQRIAPCQETRYLSICYSERLGEAGVVAESFNSLYKSGLIHRKGPRRNVALVERALLNHVDWFNNRRIHESQDYVPPVEFETHYYESNESEILLVLETILSRGNPGRII